MSKLTVPRSYQSDNESKKIARQVSDLAAVKTRKSTSPSPSTKK